MKVRSLLLFTCISLGVLMLAKAALAQDIPQGDAIRGGQLYDNWFVILDLEPPQGDHPLWQTQQSNTRSGSVTWRCSTCHGWDYKGKDGAYGPQSPQYTGFPGISSMVGLSNNEILAALDGTNNPDHNFSELINNHALVDIIAFLRTKQVDIALIIDYEDNTALGREETGRDVYGDYCIECHGFDGSALNFDTAGTPEFIGDLALENPWKFIHRVRFGRPLSEFHAFENVGLSLQNITDALTYSQTLPPADPMAGKIDPLSDDQFLNVVGQGELNAIILAAAGIVLVIIVGLAWTTYKSKT
ncbi:MAG: hypothetical protein N2C13_03540 [Chloroflexota bacterium]